MKNLETVDGDVSSADDVAVAQVDGVNGDVGVKNGDDANVSDGEGKDLKSMNLSETEKKDSDVSKSDEAVVTDASKSDNNALDNTSDEVESNDKELNNEAETSEDFNTTEDSIHGDSDIPPSSDFEISEADHNNDSGIVENNENGEAAVNDSDTTQEYEDETDVDNKTPELEGDNDADIDKNSKSTEADIPHSQEKEVSKDIGETEVSVETLPLSEESSRQNSVRVENVTETDGSPPDEEMEVTEVTEDNIQKEKSDSVEIVNGDSDNVNNANSLSINDDEPEKEVSKTDSAKPNAKSSCTLLFSTFGDDSSKEKKDDKGNSSQEEEEETPKKKDGNTISLEEIDPNDTNSASADSEDEMDINAGLDACFNALEKKIESESNKDDKVKESEENNQGSEDKSPAHDVASEEEKSRKASESQDDDEIMTVDPDDNEETVLDHSKALEEIENIEKTTKKILDDESESNKRRPSAELSSEPESKRAKMDGDKDSEAIIDTRKFKKLIKKMTRSDLEEMIESKMIELIKDRTEIGQLRKKVDSYEAKVEKWQARAQALSKQCTDLGTVMKKYITDVKNKPRDGARVTPVKITRSVGLQVMTAAQRNLQQQKQQLQLASGGARIATKPPTAATKIVNAPVRVTPVKNLVNNNMNQGSKTNGVILRQAATPSPRSSPAIISRAVPAAAKVSPAAAVASRTNVTITPKQTSPAAKPAPSKNVIDVVDLSDEDDPDDPKPVAQKTPVKTTPTQLAQARARPGVRPGGGVTMARTNGFIRKTHPAPLPATPTRQPSMAGWKMLPAKPALKINKRGNGIVLSWNLTHTQNMHATIISYQLYAYQESGSQLPDSSLWKKVGDVKALPLPMACTLTQFMAGNKYHFAVRAVDCHNRLGPFSEPNNITLN